MQKLQKHYHGDVESYKRIQKDKHNNENIFYKAETSFWGRDFVLFWGVLYGDYWKL